MKKCMFILAALLAFKQGLSLPTADEWAYLCGGGCRTLFPWGDGMDYSMHLHHFERDVYKRQLFDFFLLDELSPRDEADGRATFTLPGMAFARDGSGGEYHLLEDPVRNGSYSGIYRIYR